jgi:hypothetical protein
MFHVSCARPLVFQILDMANTSCPVYSIIASHSYISRLCPWETSCPKLHLYLYLFAIRFHDLSPRHPPCSVLHLPSQEISATHRQVSTPSSWPLVACPFSSSRVFSLACCISLTPNLTSHCHRASTISLPQPTLPASSLFPSILPLSFRPCRSNLDDLLMVNVLGTHIPISTSATPRTPLQGTATPATCEAQPEYIRYYNNVFVHSTRENLLINIALSAITISIRPCVVGSLSIRVMGLSSHGGTHIRRKQ